MWQNLIGHVSDSTFWFWRTIRRGTYCMRRTSISHISSTTFHSGGVLVGRKILTPQNRFQSFATASLGDICCHLFHDILRYQVLEPCQHSSEQLRWHFAHQSWRSPHRWPHRGCDNTKESFRYQNHKRIRNVGGIPEVWRGQEGRTSPVKMFLWFLRQKNSAPLNSTHLQNGA